MLLAFPWLLPQLPQPFLLSYGTGSVFWGAALPLGTGDHAEGLDHPCSMLASLPAAGMGIGISLWCAVGINVRASCSLWNAGFRVFPMDLALEGGRFWKGW